MVEIDLTLGDAEELFGPEPLARLLASEQMVIGGVFKLVHTDKDAQTVTLVWQQLHE